MGNFRLSLDAVEEAAAVVRERGAPYLWTSRGTPPTEPPLVELYDGKYEDAVAREEASLPVVVSLTDRLFMVPVSEAVGTFCIHVSRLFEIIGYSVAPLQSLLMSTNAIATTS